MNPKIPQWLSEGEARGFDNHVKHFGRALARIARRDWQDEKFEPYKWAQAP